MRWKENRTRDTARRNETTFRSAQRRTLVKKLGRFPVHIWLQLVLAGLCVGSDLGCWGCETRRWDLGSNRKSGCGLTGVWIQRGIDRSVRVGCQLDGRPTTTGHDRGLYSLRNGSSKTPGGGGGGGGGSCLLAQRGAYTGKDFLVVQESLCVWYCIRRLICNTQRHSMYSPSEHVAVMFECQCLA